MTILIISIISSVIISILKFTLFPNIDWHLVFAPIIAWNMYFLGIIGYLFYLFINRKLVLYTEIDPVTQDFCLVITSEFDPTNHTKKESD